MQKVYYRYKTRAMSIILMLALITSLGACSLSESAPSNSPTPAPEAETEEVIICKINDAVITRSDFEPIFNAYYQYYGQFMDMTNEDAIKSLQDDLFNSLVRAEVLYQQAQKAGITLSADDESEITKAVEEEYNSLLEQFRASAQSEGAENVEVRAIELFAQRLIEQGLTVETYKAKAIEEKRKAAMMEALYNQVIEGVSYTEQNALSDFAADLQAQIAEYTEDPAKYETALESFQNTGGIPPLFIPEGYVRVKHILVETEDEANEMLRLLDEGADFDELMAEHGTDPGMKYEPNMSQGYLMGPGTAFDAKFKEAGFALENVGDYSGIVKSSYDYGYHIIKLVEIVESREIAFDELKDDYINAKLEALKSEHFTAEVEKWTSEADITSYIGRIRDLGKAS